MIKSIIIGAALLVALDANPAQAEPLTYEAALARANTNASSLRARVHGIDAARDARDAAGALPDPKLAIGVDSFPVSGPLAFEPSRDNFTWARIGVSQDFPNLAKRHAAQGRADADLVAAGAETAVEARTVEVQTALAWITLAYAERRLAALDAVLGRLDKVVRAAPSAVASGTSRPAQTLAGRQAVAAMQDRRDELVSASARARAELTRWTGDPQPEIVGPIPDFTLDPAALRGALDGHPTIRMTGAKVGQADADVRLAQAQRRSDFGIDVAFQRRDPRFGDYVSAGVTIGLPLFTKHRQEPLIAAREADAATARADQEAARRALTAELDAGLADHVMHHDQWMRARDTLQPLAEERVRLETASYAAGRATLIDLVDAHAALADVTLTTLDREANVATDGARLTLLYRSDAQ